MSDEKLIGAWRLLTYLSFDSEGRTGPGPLGEDPRGMLVYSADGCMSVGMMRADGPADNGYMGYAGTWRVEGGQVMHQIEVSSHGYMVGSEQVRDVVLEGDELTLFATVPGTEPAQRRVLRWSRVA